MVLKLTSEDVIFDDLDAAEEDVVKLVHFLRRAPGVGREQFASAWRDEHAFAVTEAARDAKGLVRKYIQNPVLGSRADFDLEVRSTPGVWSGPVT